MSPPGSALTFFSRSLALPEQGSEEIRRGLRLSLVGLSRDGERWLTQGLKALEEGGAPTHRAEALWVAAQASRAVGNGALAVQRLSEAVQTSGGLEAGQFGLCMLVLLEEFVAMGHVDDARRKLIEVSPRLDPSAADVLNGFLQTARGMLDEGIRLLRTGLPRLGPTFAPAWPQLLIAEALLDKGKWEEAEEGFAALIKELAFGELHVRALTGAAWTAVRRAALPVGGITAKAAAHRVQSALRYSINMPRYASQAVLARSVLAVLEGRVAPKELLAQAAPLTELGYPYDEGRLLTHAAEALEAKQREQSAPVRAQARQVLSRLKLNTRLAATSPESEQGASVFHSRAQHLSRSLAASRVLGKSLMTGSLHQPALGEGEDIELDALFEVTRYLLSSPRVEDVLARLLESVVKVVRAERGALLRRQDDGSLLCAAAKGMDPSRVRPDGGEISYSVIREAEQTGEVVLSDNARADERFRAQASVMATEIRSVLCAPLRTARGLYGYLYVDNRASSRIFREHHRELLTIFSGQAAAALETAFAFREYELLNSQLEERVQQRTEELQNANSQLERSLHELKTTQLQLSEAQRDALEKEMVVARGIQESLLPGPEPITRPGLTLCGRIEPATYCGGDVWTYFALPGGRTLIFIGDATGHGVGAGLISVAAKAAAASALWVQPDLGLGRFLEALSTALRGGGTGSRVFMTGCVCLVDPTERTVTLAGAAHEFPYWIAFGEGLPTVEPIPIRGSRLGEPDQGEYETVTRSYSKGDRLLFYTDGFTGCRNAKGKEYGVRLARKSLVAHAREPAPAFVAGIAQDLRTFLGDRPLDDDVTVVALDLD